MNLYKLIKRKECLAVYDCETPVGSIADKEINKRIRPLVRKMLETINDDAGIPKNLHVVFDGDTTEIILDDEIGAKLGLLSVLLTGKTQKSISIDRAELMTRRIMRFSREEAAYWLSRCTCFKTVENDWAAAGMVTMLCGHKNTEVFEQLERLRYR